MTPGLLSGLSGTRAAATLFANSASNVANIRSTRTMDLAKGVVTDTPFIPQVVQSITMQDGSVTTALTPLAPPTLPLFEPDNPSANVDGVVDYPNIDLAQEVVTQIRAKVAYSASLKSIEAGNNIVKNLLDIQG